MKIWLDDIRTRPSDEWTWIRDAPTFFLVYQMASDSISEISFDHDLGKNDPEYPYENNGYTIAKFIEYLAFTGQIDRIKWGIHSANSAGRRNIELAMKSAERFWKENGG